MKLLHIVPKPPPAIDGLTDFALRLGEALSGDFGIESLYLAPEPNSVEDQLRRTECDALLLHYSGYGYQHRGVPFWLIGALERFSGRVPLSVFFHELWTATPPWRSPLYFAPAQFLLIRRLERIARHVFTSTPKMKRRLRKRALLTPIPSNIPAVSRVDPPRGEQLRIVVFGQEHTRERSIRSHAKLLRLLVRNERLAVLKLIGKSGSDFQTAQALVGAERVAVHTDLPAEEVANELALSDLALSFYPMDCVTKSGSIMAAVANGCPVLLPAQRVTDAYLPRLPVIVSGGSADEALEALSTENLGRTAAEALAWYHAHASWERMAEKLGPVFAGRAAVVVV